MLAGCHEAPLHGLALACAAALGQLLNLEADQRGGYAVQGRHPLARCPAGSAPTSRFGSPATTKVLHT